MKQLFWADTVVRPSSKWIERRQRTMKKMCIIGAIAAVIFTSGLTGCNTMRGEHASVPESAWPWEQVTPESQGISSGDLQRMVAYIDENNLAIDSVVIYTNGTIPFETYFEPYSAGVSHNMKSTSKGVISALVGIALHEGYIESLDDSVLSYLPDYEPDETGKAAITIQDLLTMSAGLEWNENDLNSMYTFFVSKRITGRVLDQHLVDEPGQQFNYLHEGEYAGRQIVPREWVRESTTPQITGSFHNTPIEYGYLWWIGIGNPLFTYLEQEGAFLAMGVHGQRIVILPELDTVVVITADQGDASQCDILIRDFILPAL
jgi:hypothetical protein